MTNFIIFLDYFHMGSKRFHEKTPDERGRLGRRSGKRAREKSKPLRHCSRRAGSSQVVR